MKTLVRHPQRAAVEEGCDVGKRDARLQLWPRAKATPLGDEDSKDWPIRIPISPSATLVTWSRTSRKETVPGTDCNEGSCVDLGKFGVSYAIMHGILDVDSRLLSNLVRAWSWRNDVQELCCWRFASGYNWMPEKASLVVDFWGISA